MMINKIACVIFAFVIKVIFNAKSRQYMRHEEKLRQSAHSATMVGRVFYKPT